MDKDAEAVGNSASSMASALNKLGNAANKAATNMGKAGESGKKIAKTFADGIIKNTSVAESAAANMAIKVVAKLRGNYSTWYSVGSYLISGMVSGIASQQSALEAQVVALESKAERAVEAKAKIKSPSKVWMRIGSYMGEGLAIGIKKSGDQVVNASEGLASASEIAISSAIQSISDAINNDMDTTPVITPVVDLDNVRNGAALASSMFSSNIMGIRGNGLAASINHVIQNGSGSTVEKSINNLADQIGTMTETMNSRSLNNYINIDGSTDPEAFADGLLRSFKLNARTV